MSEPMKFEDLRILQATEGIADGIWRQVVQWDPFARDTVGGQLVRASEYALDWTVDGSAPLFADDELAWLTAIPKTQYPISFP